MAKTIDAWFDGDVFRPTEPVKLPVNTRVRITLEAVNSDDGTPSFIRTARSLNLDAPPDWSANLDSYLYDNFTSDES